MNYKNILLLIIFLLLSACQEIGSDNEATLIAIRETEKAVQFDALIETAVFETEIAVRLTEMAPTPEPLPTDTPIPTPTPDIFSDCIHWTEISKLMESEEICAYGNAVSIGSGVTFSLLGGFFISEGVTENQDFEDGDCVAVIGEISIWNDEVPYMDSAATYHCQPFMDQTISYIQRCGDEIEEYCIYSIGISYDDQLINIQKTYLAEGNVALGINGETYKCRSLDSAPKNIYCTGPKIDEYDSALVEIFDLDSMDLIARGIFDLPSETSPPEPAKSSSNSSYP